MFDREVQNETDAEAEPHLSDHDSASAQEVASLEVGQNERHIRVVTEHAIPDRGTPDPEELLARITINPGIFGGKPIIRGMRFAVHHVLGMLAAGDSVETILSDFSSLEPEDIQACLIFAYRTVVGKEMSFSVAGQDDS